MTIYISGPMTGLPDLNFPAFHAAAEKLRADGWDVVNPAEINPDPAADWSGCMRRDIVALMDCDSVLMLPGWTTSKGAALEFRIAFDLGMTVYYGIEDVMLREVPA